MNLEIKQTHIGILVCLFSLIVAGCSRVVETTTTTPTASGTIALPSSTTTYSPYIAPVYTPPVNTAVDVYPYPGPGAGVLQTPISPVATDSYPAPQSSPNVPTPQGPTPTSGIGGYPGPATSFPTALNSPQATITAVLSSTLGATLAPTATLTPTATARISKPLGTPPPPPATITIWHSWRDEQFAVLEHVIRSFQDQFPDVYFNVIYFPFDELYESYRQAAYYGGGPSVLFGPADWGPPLYDTGLIADLLPYTSTDFLSTINSPALATGIYHAALLNLPFNQRGVLLIRNRAIINKAPQTFEDMVNLSIRATGGSIVGAYLERGSLFSAAHLVGLGGSLMDDQYNPTFDDLYGLEWMDLLGEFERLGPTSFNNDSDVASFKDGKVGMIIDGSWNLNQYTEAIGEEILTIDPWPTFGEGRLSGFVQTDGLYLNANIQGDEQLAALRFMGYLLDKEVQSLLAEAGFIPSVIDAQPQIELIRAAMTAFQGGTPYPVVPTEDYLRPYWDALDAAIQDVFEFNVDPVVALQTAKDYVIDRLDEIHNER